MDLIIIAFFALFLRIFLLGSERIFLKQLEDYDSVIISTLFFLTGSLFLFPILLVIPKETLFTGLEDLQLAFISSIVYTFGFFAYVKALSEEDASLIAPLYNSSLLWLLILSIIFLDENIGVFRVLGGISMFIGVFFLYPGKIAEKIQKIKASRASLLMIGGSFFLALGRIIDTYAIRTIDSRVYAFSILFFAGVFFFLIACFTRRYSDGFLALKNNLKTVIFAGIANGWAYVMLLIAIAGLEVTVAEPASLLSVFVTAFLARLILKEEIKERLPGMILIVIGAIFLIL
ncbi:MAG: DMT family transporter [Candidatus Heimdallarchaeota archaeon]|nr:MAG: DMT family transporter [Candidatus Heimdallarchaeota archaeon]